MSDITFQGLTRDLSRTILSQEQILASVKKHPKANGYVGSLPAEWIKQIPKEQRSSVIPQIYKSFSNAVKSLDLSLAKRKKATQQFKQTLCEYNIITPQTKVKFSNCGGGYFANVFKLQIGEQCFATKVFSENNLKNVKFFGNLFEQNNALYLNANKKSDWTKFYFGNLNDGYMVTQFIKSSDDFPKYKINLENKGLEYIDYSLHNFVRNHNVDYGGIKPLDDYPIQDKIAVRIIKKLNRTPKKQRQNLITQISNDKNDYYYKSKMLGTNYFVSHQKPEPPENMGFWKELLYYLGLHFKN